MSTVTLNYPDVIRVRRAPANGLILILSSFALIAITILVIVISAGNTELTDPAAVSQNLISAIPVPVARPPTADIQPIPSETPSPSSRLASEPSIVPVPVPTPPSQQEWHVSD